MKKLIIPLLAIPLTLLISHVKAATPNDTQHLNTTVVSSEHVQAEAKTTASEPTQRPEQPQTATITKSEPAPQQTAPKPARWAITTSPQGASTVANVNHALAVYQDMGMSKQGAAYLIGNFLQEKPSAFVTGDPCGGTLGDGGRAHGLGQWHPGRRQDMPCGFTAQLQWAVNTEMVRDSPHLRPILFDANATEYQIMAGIQSWERWGHLGSRWVYAANIYAQLK